MPASIKKTDKIIVDDDKVYCHGSVAVGGAHPGVYLSLKKSPEVTCPYCGISFARK